MLLSLIEEIKAFSHLSISYTIIDDGSDFKLTENFHQFKHGGKPKFWRMWDYALRMLKTDKSDIYIFMPSDISGLDLPQIMKLHSQFSRTPYAYNLINDGRTNCWNTIKQVKIDANSMRVGFTDCGFFCNKSLLNKIGYFVREINPARFEHNAAISSGVGQQLTQRMNKAKCFMYMPIHSLVYHGDHESLMHTEHRKTTPLISR